MRLKDSAVDLQGIRPEILFAAMAFQSLLLNRTLQMILDRLEDPDDHRPVLFVPPEVTITSATDGQHMLTSLHYSGSAIDFRTRDLGLSREGLGDLAGELSSALGPDFDVVLEDTHLHVEWQPKRRT